jgi:hypothetical protein
MPRNFATLRAEDLLCCLATPRNFATLRAEDLLRCLATPRNFATLRAALLRAASVSATHSPALHP